MSYKIKLYHLYPDAMNLYGDIGNVICLRQRCQWRDIDFEVIDVKIGDKIDFSDADIIYLGGGQDRGQKIIQNDLQKRKNEIKEAIESGAVALTICGGYQLFGKYFKTKDGEEIPGIEIFDAHTIAGEKRLIGNVIAETVNDIGLKDVSLVGFENHSGITTLGSETKPLAKVIKGFGNDGKGEFEGGYYKNAFGTYLHGPLLPKNPEFADLLLERALKYRYKDIAPLEKLDNNFEKRAHEFAIKRAKISKTLSI